MVTVHKGNDQDPEGHLQDPTSKQCGLSGVYLERCPSPGFRAYQSPRESRCLRDSTVRSENILDRKEDWDSLKSKFTLVLVLTAV